MLSRFFSAAAILVATAGLVLAGEYTGLVTSISKDEIKVTVRGKDKKAKGEEKTFKVGKEVKITKGEDKMEIDDVTKAIEGSKGKAKGVFAKITTDGEGDKETVTSISVIAGKKKKADK